MQKFQKNASKDPLLDQLNDLSMVQWPDQNASAEKLTAGDRAPGFTLAAVIRAWLS
jgi:hypothetical protein